MEHLSQEPWRSVCGLMSGTSLDGLDIAVCEFRRYGSGWEYRMQKADTLPYPKDWQERLIQMQYLSGRELQMAHAEYGRYLGNLTRRFLEQNKLSCEFISSHGHTIFHQPERGYTFQAGDGAALAASSGLPVVCDFRSGDVALGGQGAPLVPLGDQLLFGDYDACLNIGGFANISYDKDGKRIAFDICPANKLLNHYAQLAGKEYDEGGLMASSGEKIPNLLAMLDALPFYSAPPPKSLGEEWIRKYVFPLTDAHTDDLPCLMHTLSLHVAGQIAAGIKESGCSNVLLTGGGAYNTFLINEINSRLDKPVTIPSDELVQFKEALVFAFLGLLRMYGENNILASVTGATKDHCGGAIYLP